MTSKPKMRGILRRLSRAAFWTSLTVAAPVKLRNDPISPCRALSIRSARFWLPQPEFDWTNWPIFSSKVILAMRAVMRFSIAGVEREGAAARSGRAAAVNRTARRIFFMSLDLVSNWTWILSGLTYFVAVNSGGYFMKLGVEMFCFVVNPILPYLATSFTPSAEG